MSSQLLAALESPKKDEDEIFVRWGQDDGTKRNVVWAAKIFFTKVVPVVLGEICGPEVKVAQETGCHVVLVRTDLIPRQNFTGKKAHEYFFESCNQVLVSSEDVCTETAFQWECGG